MWQGLEERLLIYTVCHFNQLVLTLFPPSLGNREVSSASKSFGRRSLVAEMSLNQSQGDELRFWTTVLRCLWEQLTQGCSQGFQYFAGFPTEYFPSTLEGRGVWRTSSRWGPRSGWDPRTPRRRSSNTFCWNKNDTIYLRMNHKSKPGQSPR